MIFRFSDGVRDHDGLACMKTKTTDGGRVTRTNKIANVKITKKNLERYGGHDAKTKKKTCERVINRGVAERQRRSTQPG